MFSFLNLFKKKLICNKHSINFYYGPFISEDEVVLLFKKNIKTIICHVPDSEVSEKCKFNNIENICYKLNIKIFYIPFAPGAMNQNHINEFLAIKKKNNGPFYVYCKSGKRANMMLDRVNNF